ncbi:MAG: hypothetical protein Ct9H300mP12_13710 [Acidimicrobiales bacterium]|nr:MAG: hypothetical protein Ct9H300mP12_13710 [Acidimicrobiales bacterium]
MVPEDAQIAASNADLLKPLGDLNSASVVVLTGGDLCRTLGGRGRACPGGEATLVDIDVGEALVDGRLHRFVSHFVVRPSRHPGRWWVAANAAHRGRWNLAPRAHPGDGLLDVLDASLSWAEVPAAWRRLGLGVHVPHPGIREEGNNGYTGELRSVRSCLARWQAHRWGRQTLATRAARSASCRHLSRVSG